MYFDGWALSAVRRARDSCIVGTGSGCIAGGVSRKGEVGVVVSAGVEEMRKWGVVAIVRERIGRVNGGMALDAVLRSEQVPMT